MEEPEHHEEMGIERKNRKGIISVLTVKQAVKEKRLKNMNYDTSPGSTPQTPATIL